MYHNSIECWDENLSEDLGRGFGVEITKMGRAARWLKGFLGMKKEKHVNGDKVCNNNIEDDFEVASFYSLDNHRKDKKRWSFGSRSYKFPAAEKRGDYARTRRSSITTEAETKRTEGKLAEAARAALVIVRRTADSGRRRGPLLCVGSERRAALKIQAVFRGFLARKALKALKGIVKLQALIRGYMARTETGAAVQTMQALARARAAARSPWPRRSFDKENGFEPCYRPRRSIERNETRSSFHSKRYSSWDRIDGEISDVSPKIVEIDAAKTHVRLSKLNRKDLMYYDPYLPSTARGSHLFRSFTNYCDPVTPTRSLCRESATLEKHVFPDYPNYMASTQSFQAKSRSTSAPKQRLITEWTRQRPIALQEIMAARNSVTGF